MSDGIARFKDFTGDEEPIRFKVGSEIFQARDDISLKYLSQLSKLGESVEGGDDTLTKVLAIFEKLLVPESFERFRAAVEGDGDTIIGVTRFVKIVPWLLEQYGLRPTEASSGSSDTSSENGASSTDGASLVALTS